MIGRVCGLGLLLCGTALAAEPTIEPLLRLETGMHTASIRRIATDSAGRWAVTASDDKTARVWEVASGRQVAVLRPPQDAGNEGKLYAVAMSPDGKVVAVAGWTGWDWTQESSIYLFDRASIRLLRRIQGLPNVVHCLSYSPDGRWLAASLGRKNGIRLFDAASGAERGRDADYGGDSYSVHFSRDSLRLVSTSYDGQVRVHGVDEQGGLRLLKVARPTGGTRPFAARFSPDGQRIALGFSDSRVVQVLDAQSLAELARPATTGVGNGDLSKVAWSADGRSLLAGGMWDVDGKSPVRRWAVDDWSRYQDMPVTKSTVFELVPLPAAAGGGWLFAAGDPSWGVLDAAAQVLRRQDEAIADFRSQTNQLRLSADGRRVRFGYLLRGKDARVFDPGTRSLDADNTAAVSGVPLQAARTDSPDLTITNWEDQTDPKLNGKPLTLKPFEISRSLAIAPDGRRFVLGAEWTLRLFDSTGQAVWAQPVPDVVWAVNVSADSRFVVAAYGDGTIRWHRLDNGKEILAFFPHADRKRWVAWTPEGYFDASPGADGLIGYHLNRGQDREGEFVSARQLWETFYQPGLVARRLDADGDQLLAEQVKRRGDVRNLLTAGSIPELVLESAAEAQTDGSYQLSVRIRNAGQGTGKLVLRVDGGAELAGRWNAPALTPGSVVAMPVDLAAGLHKLTVELVDGRGVASKTVSAQVNVRRPVSSTGATLHVLAVGVTNYRDSDLKLKYAADDAQAIAGRLKLRGDGLFNGRVVTRTLTDKDATLANIGKTLADMAAKARPDDTFVLFMAGHGTTLDDQYYFLPYELDYVNDNSIRNEAVSQAQLRSWLSLLPVRSLLLLDTCRAGNAVQLASRAGEEKGAFSTLIRLSNRAVIVASSNNNMALEGYEGHGVFSWVVLDAIDHADYDENGRVDVSDIATHVRRLVPAITEQKIKYRQVPMQDTPGDPFAVAVPLPRPK